MDSEKKTAQIKVTTSSDPWWKKITYYEVTVVAAFAVIVGSMVILGLTCRG